LSERVAAMIRLPRRRWRVKAALPKREIPPGAQALRQLTAWPPPEDRAARSIQIGELKLAKPMILKWNLQK